MAHKNRPKAVVLNKDKIRDKKILDHIEYISETVGVSISEQFKQAMEFYMEHKNDTFSSRVVNSNESLQKKNNNFNEKKDSQNEKPMLGGFHAYTLEDDE